MVFCKDTVVFFFLLVVITGFTKSEAAVYKVGDSAGWTNVGKVDYKTWAAAKTFHVGDVIVFEYNKEFHNVVRVTHKNFKACNAGGSYESYISGNDSFVIKNTGHFFFICSVPGHCESGQKVDIRVPGIAAGEPSTSPTPSPAAPTPIATPPSSSQPPEPTPWLPPSSPSPPTLSPEPAPPTASPPVSYEAPAPAPAPAGTSGSSFISSSKGLIVLSSLSLFLGIGW